MRRFLGLALLLSLVSPALGQTAREEGKALGEAAAVAAAGLADSEATATTNLPGYNGGNAPERSYLKNPTSLDAAGFPASRANEASVLVVDGSTTRPRVSKQQVDEIVARSEVINQSPETYVRGLDASGATGTCVALPPSTSSPGTFEATCNTGIKVIEEPRTCRIPLQVTSTQRTIYDYQCSEEPWRGLPGTCAPNFDPLIGGICQITKTENMPVCLQGQFPNCTEPDFRRVFTLECTAPVPNEPTPTPRVTGSVVTTRDESLCTAATQGLNCSNPVEVCTDSDPVTRIIDGTPVTQPCWAWNRTYQCNGTTTGNDCGTLASNPACKFARTECLDNPRDGACKVEEHIYTCPIPATTTDTKQMVCGGDIYCVGGECEAVTREASDEFKDAVVGLNTLDETAKQFDEVDYKLFKGSNETCAKPVFGLANCCGGNGIPLIGTCSAQERQLSIKIDKGTTHFVGTFCSKSFLGICTSKRQSYCSFTSKLTRILQQQGRVQIGKAWGDPKRPNCDGFTIDEFASLDLSRMGFAEIYSEFMEAAKLPNEAAAMADIQQKIADYYSRGRP